MKNLIAAGLMMLTLGMAALAEPVAKTASTQSAPAPIVTTSAQLAPVQPEIKQEQATDKKPAEPLPSKPKKPVELNFRNL